MLLNIFFSNSGNHNGVFNGPGNMDSNAGNNNGIGYANRLVYQKGQNKHNEKYGLVLWYMEVPIIHIY